ncbi:SGNH/GDSL hydrolase family protein [Hoyosella sp. YIM 151337]|uniref:SGNH/GDSL hydrolase family protein n=1 Tax=Hoyosella sp. YIM 151337 TaxID=2992742 RepID=UPI0022367287|nr:SGNH/GDSL hydrolase family protein [Hoyosella sp. YIM 151337]MCW4352729.1 SGNH/GDSL hydrolase family protein [Hoyosella sp. YIM 151337]
MNVSANNSGWRRFSRAVSVIVSALAVAAGTLAAAGTASAQPADVRYVSFGDSFTSGPSYDPFGGCPQLPYTWPKRFAAQWGLGGDWFDASCSGAVVDGRGTNTFGEQLAAARGALGPRTELVTIQFGGNETYGGAGRSAAWSVGLCIIDFVNGCNDPADPAAVRPHAVTGAEVARRLTAGDSGNLIGEIRRAAPNARIAIVGYPTILPDDTSVCMPVNGVEAADFQPRARYAHEMLQRIEQAQREAAGILGVEFWSLKAATAGRDMCKPVGQRWITRAGDFHEELLPFHPTREGYAAQAAALTAMRTR